MKKLERLMFILGILQLIGGLILLSSLFVWIWIGFTLFWKLCLTAIIIIFSVKVVYYACEQIKKDVENKPK